MTSELDAFKKARIKELTATYDGNVSRLRSALNANIRSVQQSRGSASAKQSYIQSLTNKYNLDVAQLKKILSDNILKIQQYTPPPLPAVRSKAALLVGINYVGTSNELFGCVNDVNNVKERLSTKQFSKITTLTDAQATKAAILQEFKQMMINAVSGDVLFFMYSGHGSYMADQNGDETTGYDQLIIPVDLNPIRDDDLKTLIQMYLKPNVTLFAMFDSCFSGTVLDLRYQFFDSLNYDKYTENNKELETPGHVFMISGCSDVQTSADAFIDGKSSGAMTWSLLSTLKSTTGSLTWRELIRLMRDALKESQYEQIPQFSCGNFENIDLPVFI